jgi:hypothetical protein
MLPLRHQRCSQFGRHPGGKRTYRGRRISVAIDPGRVKTFFILQKLHAAGRDPRRRDHLSIFWLFGSGVNPGVTSGRARRPERSHGAHSSTRSSRADRREKWFDADDVQHAREVVGEDVQCHLGRHLRQRGRPEVAARGLKRRF